MASLPREEFLEDFGEETTAVELASPGLVAATATRDDALDARPYYDDDAPTCTAPVDVAAMLAILAAEGLPSPLGDVPAPPTPPAQTPPAPMFAPAPPRAPFAHLLRTDYPCSPPPAIRLREQVLLLYAPVAPPGHGLRLALVAFGAFALTIATTLMIAGLCGMPLLRR